MSAVESCRLWCACGVLHGGIWCGVLESDGHGGAIKCGQW